MELKNLREQIDQIDHEIIIRILQRRELIRQVAEYKTEHHLPVFAPDREQQVLSKVGEQVGHDNINPGLKLVYGILMDLNKLYEYQIQPKEFEIPTALGGASVRAILSDHPGALTRYLSPLAAADISITGIHSQAMPGGKMAVDIEMVGKIQDPDFIAALSVLSDTAEQFTLL